MHILKTWCESTKEGRSYLRYNGYRPLFRIGKYWVVTKLGNPLKDVNVIL